MEGIADAERRPLQCSPVKKCVRIPPLTYMLSALATSSACSQRRRSALARTQAVVRCKLARRTAPARRKSASREHAKWWQALGAHVALRKDSLYQRAHGGSGAMLGLHPTVGETAMSDFQAKEGRGSTSDRRRLLLLVARAACSRTACRKSSQRAGGGLDPRETATKHLRCRGPRHCSGLLNTERRRARCCVRWTHAGRVDLTATSPEAAFRLQPKTVCTPYESQFQ